MNAINTPCTSWRAPHIVMAGLVPAIHVAPSARPLRAHTAMPQDVDAEQVRAREGGTGPTTSLVMPGLVPGISLSRTHRTLVCAMEPGIAVLRVADLDVYYGAIAAVREVSLELRQSEIVCLLGPNGAGKTTVLNAIVGEVAPRSGVIEYLSDGESIELQDLPPHARARLGIVSVAAHENILPRFTVEENLEVGAYLRRDRKAVREDMEAQYARFPILKERRRQFAGTLSGGQQKMLAMARALMARPRMLILDEPSLGLAGAVMGEVFDTIRSLNREHGLEILLVEQNVRKGLEYSDRAYVMRIGGIEFSAPSRELLDSDRIELAYFGGGAGGAAE